MGACPRPTNPYLPSPTLSARPQGDRPSILATKQELLHIDSKPSQFLKANTLSEKPWLPSAHQANNSMGPSLEENPDMNPITAMSRSAHYPSLILETVSRANAELTKFFKPECRLCLHKMNVYYTFFSNTKFGSILANLGYLVFFCFGAIKSLN